MNHSNISQSSLDENMYDVSISRNLKKGRPGFSPRRVGSLTSLTTLSEISPNSNKRPGDFFIAKLNNSNPNLATAQLPGSIRPKSGESIVSLQSNISDETNHSSQFDPPDSRLSSLTSSSIIASPNDSPKVNHYSFASSTDVKIAEEEEGDLEDTDKYSVDSSDVVNSSVSTITLRGTGGGPAGQSLGQFGSSSLSLSTPAVGPVSRRPRLKSINTTPANSSTFANSNSNGPASAPLAGAPGLSRSKTKYLSAQQIKERQQLRKKLYDENDNDDDDDDEIGGLDLAFNVPMIHNHSEIYLHRKPSVSGSIKGGAASRSHSNLKLNDDKFYPSPFPLPSETSSGQSQFAADETSDITHSISQYYSQRSTSISKLAKLTRENDLLYKLPNFIKSQSSLDDINLISTEKINILDQSRPINLPPKSLAEISKHNKEFKKCLSDYELSNQNLILNRQKQFESQTGYIKQWKSIAELCQGEGKAKELSRKLYKEKNEIRSLNWSSNCPTGQRMQVWKTLLEQIDTKPVEFDSFAPLEKKYSSLPADIRSTKDAEFNITIDAVLSKPIYTSIVETVLDSTSTMKLKEDFKTLLYLQTMSSEGLYKQDEIFLMPSLLLIFKDAPLQEVYEILQLIRSKIFHKEFVQVLNASLARWSGESSRVCKMFASHGNRDNLKEFEGLNMNKLWEILTHLSDTQPLSLSTPSTPILIKSFSSLPSDAQDQDPRSASPSSESTSAALELLTKVFQSLIIYLNSSSPRKFHLKLIQSLLANIFKYHHFGWNNYNELISNKIPIKFNKSDNANENLISFMNKWKDCLQSF